jgi:HAE1 family hydrophobic/amphiphilic exporter-1
MPQVKNVFTVLGYSLLESVAESNAAFVLAKLKPFEIGAAQSIPHKC